MMLAIASGLSLWMTVFSQTVEPDAGATVDVVIVQGAAGSEEYGTAFTEWAGHWELAALQAKANITVIGRESNTEVHDRDRLQTVLQSRADVASELWLILIGHGTFDRREAKFNLRGPDVSATELKDWLKSVHRPVAIIDTSAASAPFLQALAGPQRVLITATKSGGEQNFPYFGRFLSEAITHERADLDKDDQISLWEAYLFASRRTAEYYRTDGRLQTEHAILDDNGDGQGTRAEAFDGLQPTQSAADGKTPLDGDAAHAWHLIRHASQAQLARETLIEMQRLETAIRDLKRQKNTLAEDDYYTQLETLLVALSRLSAAQ
jgi:hypothetical protein